MSPSGSPSGLGELTHRLAFATDARETFDVIVCAAVELTGARLARLWVVDRGRHRLVLRAAAGPGVEPRALAGRATLDFGADLVGAAVAALAPLYARDLREDPRCLDPKALNAAGLRAGAAIPLVGKGRAVGALWVGIGEVRGFSLEEQEILILLAGYAALAVERWLLSEDLMGVEAALSRTGGLGEAARGVAHDFNSLLAAILGRAQFMLRKLPGLSEADARRCLAAIERAALEGAQHTRRLQEVARAASPPGDASIDEIADRVFGAAVSSRGPEAETGERAQHVGASVMRVDEHRERGAPAGSDPGLRILVIDDEPVVRGMLAEMLRTLGHDVIEAADGFSGLGLLDTIAFDLVFVDLGLPGMSGWEVVDRIKDKQPSVGCVLITGWGVQVSEDDLAAHRVDTLLSKPFEINEVRQALAGFGAALCKEA